MTQNTPAFNFKISTPNDWVHVPSGNLDGGQFTEWINQVTRLSNLGIPPAVGSIMRLVLEQINDESSEFGAYFLDVFDVEGDGEPYIVFAILTLIPGSLGGEECPSVQELEEQVRATYGDTLTQTKKIRTGDGRECLLTSIVVDRVFGTGEERVNAKYVDLRVLVPLKEFDQIVSLLLVTPNIELEEEFRELFETIASTLRFEAASEEDLTRS